MNALMKKLLKVLKVEFTLSEEMLGMSPDPNIFEAFIGKNAPDAEKLSEELKALVDREGMTVDEAKEAVIAKGMTVFPRGDDGCPILWDYQMKGFCKDACGMLARSDGTVSSTIKAYKKTIDGLVFPQPRRIRLNLPEGGEILTCQRPLRASTKQGDITALSASETVPAGTKFIVEFGYFELKGKGANVKLDKDGKAKRDKNGEIVMSKSLVRELIIEWCDYTVLRGFGQWRNSGKGRALYKILDG